MSDGKGNLNSVTGAQLSRRHFLFAYSLVTSLFFIWGFAYGLLDSLNKHFQTVFHISKAQSTGLQAAYFGSYFVFSPFAGMIMRRFGYKKGIHMGLTLYSLGAILFWPCAKYASYPGFLVCTFVTACGLSALEVAANSYIIVIGTPRYASFRLTFSQSFNGVATVIGPLIASHAFFNGANQYSLHTVQYVYLAVACLGVLVNVLFALCPLPEVRQQVTEELEAHIKGSFFKQWHTILGFGAEWLYVGAQVAVASLAINYFTEQPGDPISSQAAANLYSACQAAFTIGRFLSTPVLGKIDPALMLFIYGTMCAIFCICTALIHGVGGIVCLFIVFFFESICYPVIFSLATANLGSYQKLGSALLAMGVSGGAAYPSIQATLADAKTTQISYLVAMAGYIFVALYGLGMHVNQSINLGRWQWRNPENEEIIEEVVAPTLTDVARRRHNVDVDVEGEGDGAGPAKGDDKLGYEIDQREHA